MERFNLRKYIKGLLPAIQQKIDFGEYFNLYKKGEFKKAYTVLQDIIEKHPKYPKKGDLYLECAELELLVNDDVRKAREYLDKALEFSCHFMANYYNSYGYVLWRMGEHERGIEYCEKSVELDPRGNNLTTLGTLLSTDNDKRAVGIWEKVLEEDPNSCIAHTYLARAEYNSGDRHQAFLMLHNAENLNPTCRDYANIGRLYYEMEEFQSALDSYLNADEHGYEPKGSTYAAIATCYASMGEDILAEKYIKMAVQLNPENDYVQQVMKELKVDFENEGEQIL
jgi:tetratricopeptide (TPR) repeat protein